MRRFQSLPFQNNVSKSTPYYWTSKAKIYSEIKSTKFTEFTSIQGNRPRRLRCARSVKHEKGGAGLAGICGDAVYTAFW